MSNVSDIIAENSIVVFATPTCPFCHAAIDELKNGGHTPMVVHVTTEQRAALREKTGVTSVPNIWVKGTFIGGMNDGPESWMGLKKVMQSGKFSELLSK